MADTRLCFQILGIQPTNDKKQIKKAYAQKVSQCHPEENEKEWMLLHEAYQKALHAAEQLSSNRFSTNHFSAD